MAGITVEPFVSAVEFETSADIVVKVPDLPVPHIVAVLAFCTEFPPMHVVVLMAPVTGCGSLVAIELACMATFTGRGAMFADKRVFRVLIVVEGHGFPVLFAMAFLAFLPEGGPVDVVFLMAGIAVGRRLVFIQRALVAAVAFRLPMIALEGVCGVAIMLKEQDFPVPFSVATLAFLAITAFMFVIFLVAGVAIGRCLVFVQISLVTGVAGGGVMSPPQGVFRV